MVYTLLLAALLSSGPVSIASDRVGVAKEKKSESANQPLSWSAPAIARVFQGTAARWNISMKNTSWHSVELNGLLGSGGGSGWIDIPLLATGLSSGVHLQAPTDGLLGLQYFSFRILGKDSTNSQTRIRLSAFVDSAYIPELPILDFKAQRRDQLSAETLSLKSFEIDQLDLVSVTAKPSWLEIVVLPRDTSANPQEIRLQATLKPEVANGVLDATVRLKTNLSAQPFVDVRVVGAVFDEVVADPFPLHFGAVNKGKPHRQTIRLSGLAHHNLDATSIRQTSDAVAVSYQGCGQGCLDLLVVLKADSVGPANGFMTIAFSSGQKDLVIPYTANIVSESTEIIDLGTLQRGSDTAIDGAMKLNP